MDDSNVTEPPLDPPQGNKDLEINDSLPMVSIDTIVDDSSKSSGRSVSEDSSIGIQLEQKNAVDLNSERNSPTSKITLPRMGSNRSSNHQNNSHLHMDGQHVDPTDILLNPDRYLGYEQCIDTRETVADILAKQLDNVKDYARDRTVFSLGAGEMAVVWTYKKLKYLSKRWFTHFILLLIILVYSVIGATIFMLLEAPYEEVYDMQLDDVRRDLAAKLEKIVRNETIMKTNPDFFELIEKELIAYENGYSECLKNLNNNNTTQNSWTFWNSMVFAGTIYTTIGYGHISPKTAAGRFATICYAIIGVPLFLIVLTDFGKLLTRIIKFFWMYGRNLYYIRTSRKVHRAPGFKKGQNSTNRFSQIRLDGDKIENRVEKKDSLSAQTASENFEVDDEFNLPITLAIFLLIFYMVCGASVIQIIESWSFFESFYFIFISMSTIGLGDFVPHYPMYIYIAILYIIFGLSLTGMCINVVQIKISDSIKKSKLIEKMGSICDEDSCSGSVAAAPIETVPVHKSKNEVKKR